jgi:hypothetical protein
VCAMQICMIRKSPPTSHQWLYSWCFMPVPRSSRAFFFTSLNNERTLSWITSKLRFMYWWLWLLIQWVNSPSNLSIIVSLLLLYVPVLFHQHVFLQLPQTYPFASKWFAQLKDKLMVIQMSFNHPLVLLLGLVFEPWLMVSLLSWFFKHQDHLQHLFYPWCTK